MADGAVRFFLQTVGSLLAKEAFRLGSLRRDLEYIKSKLEIIQSFMKDSDSSKESSSSQKRTWRRQLNEVAYDVEDLILEFTHHMDKHEDRGRFMGFLHNSVSLPRSIFVNRRIASRLQEIRQKLLDISESAKLLPQVHGSSSDDADESWPYYAESSHFAVEEELVGIEDNKEELIRWLKNEEPQRRLVSVVGMGGLGKTTLVTNVFNSPAVKQHFQCYAWIHVSQSYKIEELLRRLIKELGVSTKEDLPENISQADYRRLVHTLIDYLQDKRFVIVLDDVWNRQAWEDICIPIPNNQCGSRVMLTTRNRELGVEDKVFPLQPLDETDAWALFCRKAFWNIPNKSCPQELERVAKAIVDKCAGLPLAIVAIGGVMSLKERRESEWKQVEKSLSWDISNNPDLDRMKNILLHSYYDLPYHLRNCFLYCSIFPQTYTIYKTKLIGLWIAEGFVEAKRGLTMEEEATKHLRELIHRSIIKVTGPDYLQLHDLMHGLALSIAEEENFCTVYDGKEARQDCKARRLSIQIGERDISRSASMSGLRSFFVFGNGMIPSSSLSKISSNFRQLRVLFLEDASIHRVPDELDNLFNLRFLSLKNTRVEKLPKSLCRLTNLETLDLTNSRIRKLPDWIKNLKNLRHLYAQRWSKYYYCYDDQYYYYYEYVNATQATSGICELKCLQTLLSVEANAKIAQQVGDLTQLQCLDITNVKKDYSKELCSSIQKMEDLLYLYLTAAVEETLQVEELYSPPHRLQYLELHGHLEKIPHWISSFRNLLSLCLEWSQLKENPLPPLGSLPNLENLGLLRGYDGQELCFLAGCFPKLRSLELVQLMELNLLKIEQGAMPSIEMLCLTECGKMKAIPQGIEHLSSLQVLRLQVMPEEFIERLQGDASEERKLVQHIPIIKHCFREGRKWVYENISPVLLDENKLWMAPNSFANALLQKPKTKVPSRGSKPSVLRRPKIMWS